MADNRNGGTGSETGRLFWLLAGLGLAGLTAKITKRSLLKQPLSGETSLKNDVHDSEPAERPRDDEIRADALRLRVRETMTRRAEDVRLVVGSFHHSCEQDALRAARRLHKEWPGGFEIYSPYLNEHYFDAMDLPKSPVRIWILFGSLLGLFGAWAMTIFLSIYWPHYVDNMPVISVPPFTIIAFEMTVLFGVSIGAIGYAFHSRTPVPPIPDHYMRRFKQDLIGIALNCASPEEGDRAEKLLDELGAEDIVRV